MSRQIRGVIQRPFYYLFNPEAVCGQQVNQIFSRKELKSELDKGKLFHNRRWPYRNEGPAARLQHPFRRRVASAALQKTLMFPLPLSVFYLLKIGISDHVKLSQ